jgi:hypothetical protein
MMLDIFCPECYQTMNRKAPHVAAVCTDPNRYPWDADWVEETHRFYERNMEILEEMEAKHFKCQCGVEFTPTREDDNFHWYCYMGEPR